MFNFLIHKSIGCIFEFNYLKLFHTHRTEIVLFIFNLSIENLLKIAN